MQVGLFVLFSGVTKFRVCCLYLMAAENSRKETQPSPLLFSFSSLCIYKIFGKLILPQPHVDLDGYSVLSFTELINIISELRYF